jgi:PadR family transcriptional regulator PadR
MRTGDLKIIILKMFGNREFYGYEVHKVLMSEGVKIEISRLYRVLNKMLMESLLECRWEKSRIGPKKKVYKLGKKGKEELNNIFIEAIKIVHGFYGAYLMKLPPKTNVVNGMINLLTDGLKVDDTIVYLVTKYSLMHAMIIYQLQRKIPQGRIFLVKPRLLNLDIKLDNLVSLDGTYSNIPLKNGRANLLVVMDLPKKDTLKSSVREWHRIVKQNGKLALFTPTVLIQKNEDPLKIGDFIEKYEHETIEKGENIDKDFLLTLILNFFNKIEEKEMVHISIFLMTNPQIIR